MYCPQMSTDEVDAWLDKVADPDRRAALEGLRRAIRAAAPEAEEGMSYSLPAFRYRGRPLCPTELRRSIARSS